MKRLVDLLKCVRCGSTSFYTADHERNPAVSCSSCGHALPLHFGIVIASNRSRLNGIDYGLSSWRQAEDEKERQVENEFALTDDYLLQLPFPQNRLDTTFQFKNGAMGRNFLEVMDRIGLRGDESVLDLAAGSAWTSYLVAKRGCHVVAADQRTIKYWGLRSILTYQRHAVGMIDGLCCDFFPLPLQDDLFDLVICNNAFQYVPDLNAALREIRRVLHPCGRLVLSWTGTRGWFKSSRWGPGYTVRSYLRAMKASGFEVECLYAPLALLDSLRRGGQHHQRIAALVPLLRFFCRSGGPVWRFLDSLIHIPLSQIIGIPFNAVARHR
jgi:SAM-dependent methyltransferase